MKYHIFFFIVICSFLTSNAQEWPSKWTGDTEDFVLSDNLLTYIDDGKAGDSNIFLIYEVTPTLVWNMEVRWLKKPTTFNTFSWLLFEEVSTDNYFYRYLFTPSGDGSSIQFIRQYCRYLQDKTAELISSEVLFSYTLLSATEEWQQMTLSAQLDQQNGLVAYIFTPLSGAVKGEPISLKDGTIRGQMGLFTKYTAIHKLDHYWTIPSVVSEVSNEPLKATNITAQESGRVNVLLNKEVNISSAKVEVPDFSPTLSMGNTPKELIVELGVPFVANRTYDFSITGLQNRLGGYESLDFVIDTTVEEQPGSGQIPDGIFITEIMANPPSEGALADKKYIELYNNTSEDIRLSELTIVYRTQKYHLPDYIFRTKSYLVLYSAEDGAPTTKGAVVGLDKFPALSGDFNLSLVDALSLSIYDEIYFSTHLYGYGEKRGDASVERIGYLPSKWRRSDHKDGGTPGYGTSMKPFIPVPEHSVVINEIMLSPATTGEKYLELFHNGSTEIDLSQLYLTYRNGPDESSKSWMIVTAPKVLSKGSYAVLCPYPEALKKVHASVDESTFVERIDFPSISSTYSEIELRSRADGKVIDAVIYRRQWLGDKSSDRSKSSLERVSPDADGKNRNSWSKASEASRGGTPGLQNSSFGLIPNKDIDEEAIEWPDTPELTYEEMMKFMKVFPQYSSLDIYTLTGAPVFSGKGDGAKEMLHKIQYGNAGLPTMIFVIRVTFTHPNPDRVVLTYGGRWAHTPTLR